MNEPIKFCIICNKEIHRTRSPRGLKQRRSIFSKTCSPKCSRMFRRIRINIRHGIEKEILNKLQESGIMVIRGGHLHR